LPGSQKKITLETNTGYFFSDGRGIFFPRGNILLEMVIQPFGMKMNLVEEAQ
jgi:hypothetical protein